MGIKYIKKTKRYKMKSSNKFPQEMSRSFIDDKTSVFNNLDFQWKLCIKGIMCNLKTCSSAGGND